MKRYSDEQVATALVVLKSNGGNLKRTERQTGVSRTTLRTWEAGDPKRRCVIYACNADQRP